MSRTKKVALSTVLSALILTNLTTDVYGLERFGFVSTTASSGTGHLELENASITEDGAVTFIGAFLNGASNLSVINSSLDIDNYSVSTSSLLGDITFAGGAASNNNGNHKISNNSLEIDGASKLSVSSTNTDISLFGGFANSTAGGKHIVNNNSVEIEEFSSISAQGSDNSNISIVGGSAFFGNGNHQVFYNSVEIEESTISTTGTDNWIFLEGGSATSNSIANHNVYNNRLKIHRSTITTMRTSSNIALNGGSSIGDGNHKVYNNSIDIKDTNITSTLSGIDINGGTASGNGNHNVTNNSISIANSTLTAQEIFIDGGYASSTNSFSHNTINNKVTLSGIVNANATSNIFLRGGLAGTHTSSDHRTGNTLVLDRATVNLSSSSNSFVQNFENYIFSPTSANLTSSGKSMLTATSIALGTNANISFGVTQSSSTFKIGDTFTLLQTTSLSGNFENIDDTHTLQQGITRVYDVTTTSDVHNTVTATINSDAKITPQADVPAQAQLGSVATLNQASNLLSSAGIQNAQASVTALQKRAISNNRTASLNNQGGLNSSDIAIFAAFGGGDLTYDDINSDVEILSIVAGIAKGTDSLLYGIFVEQGTADITNNIINSTSDNSYIGGGIFAKLSSDNLYGEFSLRAGSSEIEQNGQFSGIVGNVNYDTSSSYFGAHIAVGYLKELNSNNTLDIYGKYFYTLQEGDSEVISGESFIFDDITSHRLRVGIKNLYSYSDTTIPYVGISYEQELDGEASYSANGLVAGLPTIEGSTAILEAGIKIEPSEKLPLSFDFALEGYSGIQEGVSLKAQINYLF